MGSDNHNYLFFKNHSSVIGLVSQPFGDERSQSWNDLDWAHRCQNLRHSRPSASYNKGKRTVFTANGFKLPPSPSRPSFSCSFSGRTVCGTSFSFSWSGSLESAAPPSPWLWWRSPPFPRCLGSAWIPPGSDPPPALPGDPSRWEFRLSTDAAAGKRVREQRAQITARA